jgi:hypothetical protein
VHEGLKDEVLPTEHHPQPGLRLPDTVDGLHLHYQHCHGRPEST